MVLIKVNIDKPLLNDNYGFISEINTIQSSNAAQKAN
jgi:hypothetical protein